MKLLKKLLRMIGYTPDIPAADMRTLKPPPNKAVRALDGAMESVPETIVVPERRPVPELLPETMMMPNNREAKKLTAKEVAEIKERMALIVEKQKIIELTPEMMITS